MYLLYLLLLQDVDGLITSLYVDYDRQYETLTKLHDTVAELPVILTQLQDLTDVLGREFLKIIIT